MPDQFLGSLERTSLQTVWFHPGRPAHSHDTALRKIVILYFTYSRCCCCCQFVGHIDEVKEIKFIGTNDSHIAVANNSQLVKIFEVSTWACQILSGHSDMVLSLDVYQKQGMNLLATGSKVRQCSSLTHSLHSYLPPSPALYLKEKMNLLRTGSKVRQCSSLTPSFPPTLTLYQKERMNLLMTGSETRQCSSLFHSLPLFLPLYQNEGMNLLVISFSLTFLLTG